MTALENGRHLPVAVIGAGQAGLSISRLLTDQGVEHLVIERDRSRQFGCRHAEIGRDVEDPLQFHTKITVSPASGVLDRLEERLRRQVIRDRDVGRHR